MAFLDLLTNILTLTYNTAPFWGGGYRYFPRAGVKVASAGSALIEQGHVVEGIKLTLQGWLENAEGASAQVINSLVGSFQETLGGEKNDKKIGSENFSDESGVTFSGLKLADALLAGRAESLMQTPLSYRSLLEGRPIGDLHMVIGNPMSPMAAVGNLVIKSCTMKLGDKLGADDFPTEMSFTLKLGHGRPRAKQDIESIFNLGGGAMSFSQVVAPSGTGNTFNGPTDPDPGFGEKANTSGGDLLNKANSPIKSVNTIEVQEKVEDYYKNKDGGLYKKRVTNLWGSTHGDSAVLNDYIKKSSS